MVDVSDLFLTRGSIVSTRSRIKEENKTYPCQPPNRLGHGFPLGGSHQCRFRLGIGDSRRGPEGLTTGPLIVGSASFGKGSIQQIRAFDVGGFKLTTARYYTPDGINIDKVGIEPQVIVEEEEFSEEELGDLQILYEENRIPFFVEQNPKAGAREMARFIEELRADGIILKDRVLERMIRQEVNRTLKDPPIYDLEYDRFLKKAKELIDPNGEGILWSETADTSEAGRMQTIPGRQDR